MLECLSTGMKKRPVAGAAKSREHLRQFVVVSRAESEDQPADNACESL
jgi:hypothetical protein